MNATLQDLQLTDEARKAAREEIQRLAYLAWERAGRPAGDPLRFWREAECEWICFSYVPDRNGDSVTRAPVDKRPSRDESSERYAESRA